MVTRWKRKNSHTHRPPAYPYAVPQYYLGRAQPYPQPRSYLVSKIAESFPQMTALDHMTTSHVGPICLLCAVTQFPNCFWEGHSPLTSIRSDFAFLITESFATGDTLDLLATRRQGANPQQSSPLLRSDFASAIAESLPQMIPLDPMVTRREEATPSNIPRPPDYSF